MDKSMLGDLDNLPEEDKIRMSTMIDQLQIRDRSHFYFLQCPSRFMHSLRILFMKLFLFYTETFSIHQVCNFFSILSKVCDSYELCRNGIFNCANALVESFDFRNAFLFNVCFRGCGFTDLVLCAVELSFSFYYLNVMLVL